MKIGSSAGRRTSRGVLAVVAGTLLSLVAGTTAAHANGTYSYTTTAGSSSQSLVTDTATISTYARYEFNDRTQSNLWVCYYDWKDVATVSGSGSQNSAVRAEVDYQSPTVTNRVITGDFADRDKNTGGEASFGGQYKWITGVNRDCGNPLMDGRKLTQNSPYRPVFGAFLGGAVAITVYGVLAGLGAYYSGGSVLGNPYFEAGVGCLAGIAGKLAEDKFVNGTTGPISAYATKCAVSGIFTGSLAAWYKWLAKDGNTKLFADALASAARNAFGGTANAHSAMDTLARSAITYAANGGATS